MENVNHQNTRWNSLKTTYVPIYSNPGRNFYESTKPNLNTYIHPNLGANLPLSSLAHELEFDHLNGSILTLLLHLTVHLYKSTRSKKINQSFITYDYFISSTKSNLTVKTKPHPKKRGRAEGINGRTTTKRRFASPFNLLNAHKNCNLTIWILILRMSKLQKQI